jgi:hypothetical protein
MIHLTGLGRKESDRPRMLCQQNLWRSYRQPIWILSFSCGGQLAGLVANKRPPVAGLPSTVRVIAALPVKKTVVRLIWKDLKESPSVASDRFSKNNVSF